MSGWRTVRLADVLEPIKRTVETAPDQLYDTLGVRWYGAGCFVKPGTPVKAKTMNRVALDDVVYSKLFAWKGSFAVVAPAEAGALASTEFPTFRADGSSLLPAYFTLWAARPELWDEVDALSTGTTGNSRNRLAPEEFLDLEIDLPTLAEQEVVVSAAARLGFAERAWVGEEGALRALFRSLRERDLETGDGWDDLPAGWTRTSLAEVADVRSGITKGRKTAGELSEVPFIRAANVQDGSLDLSEIKTLPVARAEIARFALAAGDVLMTEGGNAEHLGRGWLWEGQLPSAVFQNHVFRARPRREIIEPRFLAYAIGASPAREYCLESAKRTTNLASINKTQISELPVPLPPLRAQQAVVARLDAVRGSMVRAGSSAATLRRLRSALVEELISGARSIPRLRSVG